MFPIPVEYRQKYLGGDCTELPLELPDGQSPLALKLYIYCGFDVQNPVLPSLAPDTLVQVVISLAKNNTNSSDDYENSTSSQTNTNITAESAKTLF